MPILKTSQSDAIIDMTNVCIKYGSDPEVFQRQTPLGGNIATIVGETIATVGTSCGIISQPAA